MALIMGQGGQGLPAVSGACEMVLRTVQGRCCRSERRGIENGVVAGPMERGLFDDISR